MPELPEVETIRRQLESRIVGLAIKDVEVRLAKQFIGDKKEVIGGKVTGVKRRGKMLVITATNSQLPATNRDIKIVIHLKLTGQLVYVTRDTLGRNTNSEESVFFPQGIPFVGNVLPGKTTHIIFYFNDGSRLFFNDLRQFGWIRIINNEELINKNVLGKLGIEPFTPEFTFENFQKVLATWGRPIKLLLMEQSKIAGVGNIYANEALFLSKIAPHRRARDLEPEEVKMLYNNLIKVLEEGIRYKGSSGKDEAYITAFGEEGEYQEHFRVYQRDGEPCPNRCGGVIRRMELSGRGTFFCPKCQK